jgi:hypothetical protein
MKQEAEIIIASSAVHHRDSLDARESLMGAGVRKTLG